MKRISPERKAATLAKLLPPYSMTVAAVAQMSMNHTFKDMAEICLWHRHIPVICR